MDKISEVIKCKYEWQQRESKMDKIFSISKKGKILRLAISILIALVMYIIAKPIFKLLAFDAANITEDFVSKSEPAIFWVFVLTVGTIVYSFINRKSIERTIPSFKITNQIKEGMYQSEDYAKVSNFYHNKVKMDLTDKPKNFYVISKYYPKSVYALTGGWRSGKTTAAGMFINVIRSDKSVKVGSETYHDTFNFGNIDESITSFFQALAFKTGIDEFKLLSSVSTPGYDLGINFGLFSTKKTFNDKVWPNETREIIFDKLKKDEKRHIVVIDDIDRLLPNEQYQWIKVIELLGKFPNYIFIIVPVHIVELTKGLETLKLNPKYINKILPVNNRLPVGVGLAYVKSVAGISNKSSVRIKRLYTKYLISLAIREAIGAINNGEVEFRYEWPNAVDTGRISGIISAIYSGLPTRGDPNSELKVGDALIKASENMWFNNRQNLDNLELNMLIRNRFINAHISDSSISDGDINRLTNINALRDVFGEHGYSIENYIQAPASPIAVTEDNDYWKNVIWPLVKGIESDANLSSYFTYEDISREIEYLYKTKTKEEELNVLMNLILKWNK